MNRTPDELKRMAEDVVKLNQADARVRPGGVGAKTRERNNMKSLTTKEWKALAITAIAGCAVLIALHIYTWEIALK